MLLRYLRQWHNNRLWHQRHTSIKQIFKLRLNIYIIPKCLKLNRTYPRAWTPTSVMAWIVNSGRIFGGSNETNSKLLRVLLAENEGRTSGFGHQPRTQVISSLLSFLGTPPLRHLQSTEHFKKWEIKTVSLWNTACPGQEKPTLHTRTDSCWRWQYFAAEVTLHLIKQAVK